MIGNDEIGYIAWDALDVDDCRWLIKNAEERIAEVEGKGVGPNLAEYYAEQRAWLENYERQHGPFPTAGMRD